MKIAGVEWKNPITTAAGTFTPSRYYDPATLGAITTKGVSIVPWQGNPTPRIAETSSGMLNSVGLENKGVDWYIENELKELKQGGAVVVANVAGHSLDEYLQVVKKLNHTDVDMLEINISCPNVEKGGMAFGTDAKLAGELTRKIKRISRKPVIIKLTPNVTDIVTIAKRVESEGADAISLINTLVGMRIDVSSGKPLVTGGLSGPAVKPVAIRLVHDVAKHVEVPVIGMGGIFTGIDAAEFLMAGASAVAVGTAALIDPTAPVRILNELEEWLRTRG